MQQIVAKVRKEEVTWHGFFTLVSLGTSEKHDLSFNEDLACAIKNSYNPSGHSVAKVTLDKVQLEVNACNLSHKLEKLYSGQVFNLI